MTSQVACKRRHISGRGEKQLPDIFLRSQATSQADKDKYTTAVVICSAIRF